jgi:hypothetical protein
LNILGTGFWQQNKGAILLEIIGKVASATEPSAAKNALFGVLNENPNQLLSMSIRQSAKPIEIKAKLKPP